MSERAPERLGDRTPAPGGRLHHVTPKQAASVAVFVVVLVFALLNLQDVTMHWIVGTTHTPLIVLVAICVLIGVGAGFLIARRGRSPTKADG